MTKLDEAIKEAKKAAAEAEENEDPNEYEEEIDKIEAALSGVGKSKFINMGDMESIDDKYELTSGKDASNINDKKEDKKDLASVRREEFLSIYKDNNDDVEED